MKRRFKVRKYNCSVFWKGCMDEQRHRDKVGQALLKGDKNTIEKENLIVQKDGRRIKIPLMFLKEHGFKFDTSANVFVGHRHRQEALISNAASKYPVTGVGDKALSGVRECLLESETFDKKWKIEDWELPGYSGKGPDDKFNETDIKKSGRMNCLDRKRTLLANLERNCKKGQPAIKAIGSADLRFKYVIQAETKELTPVLMLLKDISSSMDEFQNEICRKAFLSIQKFLSSRYPESKIIHIVHDVNSKEVDAEEFLFTIKCGGTKCASAYNLMLEILTSRYRSDTYLCYGLHISDGNCSLADALECRSLLSQVKTFAERFAYLEVGFHQGLECTLHDVLLPLAGSCLFIEKAKSEKEVIESLGRFFSRQDRHGRRQVNV